MKRYKTLETWIEEALSDSDKEGGCSALACVYKKPMGGTKEVHAIKLAGKTWKAEELGKVFRGKAETFAQDLGGLQSFELQAFYGKAEPEASHTFTIVDGEIQAGGQSRTVRESPDGQGIIAQSMRHTETAYKLLSEMTVQLAVTTGQRLQEMALREQSLQKEVGDAYLIVREMLMDKVKISHEMQMKELEYARTTEERRKLVQMFPALANAVTGRDVFPQGTADTAIMEAFAEKVKPDVIANLVSLGLMPQELAGALTIRLTEILDRKKKETEELRKLPPSSSDPAEDAAGGNVVAIMKPLRGG